MQCTGIKVLTPGGSAPQTRGTPPDIGMVTPPRLPAWSPCRPIRDSVEAMRVHPTATHLADMGHNCNLPLLNRERSYFQADYRKPDYHLDPSFSLRYQRASEDRFAKLYRMMKQRKRQQQQKELAEQKKRHGNQEKKKTQANQPLVEPAKQISRDKDKRVHFETPRPETVAAAAAAASGPVNVTLLDLTKVPTRQLTDKDQRPLGMLQSHTSLDLSDPHTDINQIRRILRSPAVLPVAPMNSARLPREAQRGDERCDLDLGDRVNYCDIETKGRIEEWLEVVNTDQSRDGTFSPTIPDAPGSKR